MSEEYLCKICIIGIPDKLKTTMVRIFTEGKFSQDYLPSLGVDITTKQIQINNNNVKLILVDTSGKEFFGKDRPSYYRGASAAIITFDKGDRDSFMTVKKWYKEFVNEIDRVKKPRFQVPIALVGFIMKSEPKVELSTFFKIQKRLKKIRKWIDWGNYEEKNNKDIYEEITTEEGYALAEELGASYYETKLTDEETIGHIFHDLTQKALEKWL